jgi:hypothetical protein
MAIIRSIIGGCVVAPSYPTPINLVDAVESRGNLGCCKIGSGVFFERKIFGFGIV